MIIRLARPEDAEPIWDTLRPTLRAGETYAVSPDLTREEALAYWFSPAHEVFVAEEEGRVLGTYYMRANQPGGGRHVANCGYMTATAAQGRGVARAMGEHSLEHARRRGFKAMQFNFVVSTNERAVGLWQRLGFSIAGTLPGAFEHPRLGFVDVYVMFRAL
ncbi:MAG: GNAT family N-acetyltransferase [Rhodospirillales bacterium]|nr:GNAT family N-acetyltransferase [Rhodospirillales bacterium]